MQKSHPQTVLSQEQAMAMLQKIGAKPLQTIEQWEDAYHSLLENLPNIGLLVEPEGHVYNINVDWIPGDLRPMVYVVVSLVGEYPDEPHWLINTFSKRGIKCFLEDDSRMFIANRYPKEYAKGGYIKWNGAVKVTRHAQSRRSIKINLTNIPQSSVSPLVVKTRTAIHSIEPLVPVALSQKILGIPLPKAPQSPSPARQTRVISNRKNKTNFVPVKMREKIAKIIQSKLNQNGIHLKTEDQKILDALFSRQDVKIEEAGTLASLANTSLYDITNQVSIKQDTIKTIIIKMMQDIGYPLRIVEIMERAEKYGYKTITGRSSFQKSIGNICRNDEVFTKINGAYFLSGVSPKERPTHLDKVSRARIQAAPIPEQDAPEGYVYCAAKDLKPGYIVNIWGEDLRVVLVKVSQARTKIVYEDDREIEYCSSDQLTAKESND